MKNKITYSSKNHNNQNIAVNQVIINDSYLVISSIDWTATLFAPAEKFSYDHSKRASLD